jgi:fibronectin-binding autotransporter adhesin
LRQILSFTKTMVCFYNDATGRGLIAGKTLLCLVFILLFLPGTSAQRRVDSPDRGIVAIPKSANTIYLSWRHFATDPDEIAYNLYYKTSAEGALTKLNSNPVTGSTNYTAGLSTSASAYTFVVKSVLEGVEKDEAGSFTLPQNSGIHRIVRDFDFEPLPDGHPKMAMKFCWPADLNGDGAYDYVIDRQDYGASMMEDGGEATAGYPYPKVEAYSSEGVFLWRIDMGPNIKICSGHDDMVTAYDMDGDGKAEVLMAVSEGTTFADGTVIKGSNGQVTDYRTLAGPAPQWIAVVDGETGLLIDKVDLPFYAELRNQRTDNWKDIGGHFIINYLDGIRPSLVYMYKNRAENGWFYGAHAAFSYRNNKLVKDWAYRFWPNQAEFHQVRAADVDGDGRDNFVEGGYVLKHDGTILNRHQDAVHGDRHCLADIDPDRPGLEHFIIQQNNPKTLGMGLFDAASGAIIKGNYQSAVGDVGRGICGAFDATRRGMQYWSTMNGNAMYDCKGDLIEGAAGTFPSEALWWGPDLARWEISGIGSGGPNLAFHVYNPSNKSFYRDQPNLYNEYIPYYFKSINAGRAAFWGDMLGDWREELICVRSDWTGFVVLSTWEQTNHRIYHLMQNPAYRLQTTAKGYYQTPDVDFYMAADMPKPPIAPVQQADLYYSGSGWMDREEQAADYTDGKSVMFDLRGGNDTFNIKGNFSPSVLYLMNPKGADYTLEGSGKITGSTQLIKSMQGDVVLRGQHDYTGSTRISESRLWLDGSLDSPVQIDARGVLGGRGVLKGGVVLEQGLNREGGRIEPGFAGRPDTLNILGNLSLRGRNNLAFDISEEACDLLQIQGDLLLSGSENSLIIQAAGELPKEQEMTLITFSGSTNAKKGDFRLFGLEGLPYDLNIAEHSITLKIKSSREPASVLWMGNENNTWDFATPNFNWQNGASIFVPGDSVRFTDAAVSKQIVINETMPVGQLMFENEEAFSLSGRGVVSGEGGLSKSGGGILSIQNTDNSFTGPVIIENGILEVASLKDGGLPSSIGASSNSGQNWIMRNATLQTRSQMSTNRHMQVVDTLTINNPASNNSVLISGNMSGANTTLIVKGKGSLTLQGSNTFGRVILKDGLLLLGSSHANRYSMGSAKIRLEGGIFRMHNINTTSDTDNFRNEIEVPEGKTAYWDLPSRWGITSKLTGSGRLVVYIPYVRSDLNGDWSAFSGRIDFVGRDVRLNNAAARNLPLAEVNLGDGTYLMAASNGSSESSTAQTFTLGALSGTGTISGRNSLVIGSKNTSTVFSGTISSGGGRLTKQGSGELDLRGANEYTGGTIVQQGSLIVSNSSGSATGTGNVTVRSGATLTGRGSIAGTVQVLEGGILAAGSPTNVGSTLKLGRNLMMNPGSRMVFKQRLLYCDKLTVDGNISLNGTLELQIQGADLKEGRSLALFTAGGTVSGAFEAIEPAVPGEGLEWDLSRINEGILTVQAASALPSATSAEFRLIQSDNHPIYRISCEAATDPIKVEILSLTGKLMESLENPAPDCLVDLNNYPAGLYLLRVSANHKTKVFKIVKKE